MVVETAEHLLIEERELEQFVDLPEEELRWCSVKLNEIYEKKLRLEASVFDIEARHAREIVLKCKLGFQTICGSKGVAKAFYGPRFKRIWVERSDYPIYQPSQILEIDPRPAGYLSHLTTANIENLRVKKGQILLTRSGTVGNTVLVGKTFNGKIFSDDVIRISCNDNELAGYVYIFLCTKVGRALLKTNQYGSVVSHIEPEHLESIIVPKGLPSVQATINQSALKSIGLRDESNVLLKKAHDFLFDALKFPRIDDMRPKYFKKAKDLRNFSVKLSDLDNRLDGSYQVPITDSIISHLKRQKCELRNIGDPLISRRVILPGRFKRIYVDEGQGTVFFGGKQLYELDPSNKKYLSLGHHGERIKKELRLEENMVMITCSGTIGKVALVPQHWTGWAANQHIIRVVPANDDIAGYLYVFLSTDFGYELITKFTYGSVVDEINAKHVSRIPIPILKDEKLQKKINTLALLANDKRFEAYQCEQRAIQLMNDEVIHV